MYRADTPDDGGGGGINDGGNLPQPSKMVSWFHGWRWLVPHEQGGIMKTTLDLPDKLIREAKLRAVLQGRTLRDLVAEYL